MSSDDPIRDLERELLAGYRRQKERADGSIWRRLQPRQSTLTLAARVAVPVCALAIAAALVSVIGSGGAASEAESTQRDQAQLPAASTTGSAPAEAYAEPARVDNLPESWTQTDSGRQQVTSDLGARTWTTVTSWPYVQSDSGPATELPEGEFILEVLLLRSQLPGGPEDDLCKGVGPSDHFPPLNAERLSLDDAERVESAVVGGPPFYRFEGSFGDEYYVDIRVMVDRLPASADVRSRAEGALSNLRLPDWPDTC